MAELKTQPTDVSVESFLGTIADEQKRADCFTLLALMKEATGAEPQMWGTSIVGFGHYRYRYASGREGDWFFAGFSPRKQNLTLYLMSGFEQYDALMQQLGKHSVGKSCLYVKRLSDLDMPTLQALVEQSVAHMRETNS
jgi:hypothetical protein